MSYSLTWDNVGRDQEGDPGHNYKETRREVVGDDVGEHVPLKGLEGLDHKVEQYMHSCIIILRVS